MKVAVVQGGPSAEAEVSRVSARAVLSALERLGHSARAVELGPELGHELTVDRPDVVFPVAHGALGEDGCLQGLLEILDLPYVGSGVLASALATDKAHTKVVYRASGLPVAAEVRVGRSDREDASFWEALMARVEKELGAEVMVKPNCGGSAVGATRLLGAFSRDDLTRAVELARGVSEEVLLEQYHRGHEVTCGVLETERGAFALPPTLIRSDLNEWYDFASKYSSGGSRHQCPAPFPEQLQRRIERAALQAHRALGARDLSRTDFIVGDDAFVLLETNTLPGMTSVSLFPEAAAVFGIGFNELIQGLVSRAQARRRARPGLVPEFPT